MITYSPVVPHDNGFGMWKTGEWTIFGTESGEFSVESAEVQNADVNDYLSHMAENGFEVCVAPEIDGNVDRQYGDVYRITDTTTGDVSYVSLR